MRHRARIGEQPEPAERVDLLIGRDGRIRHGLAADAVIAVAAGDEVAVDPLRDTVLHIGDVGRRAVEIMDGDIRRLVDGLASRGVANITEIPCHFGLAVGGHDLAIRMLREADRNSLVIEREMHGMMLDAFPGKPVTGAGAVDQVDRRLFKDSGSDTCQNIFLGLALEYDIVDPGKVEKPPEKQA